ncbi:helix-turn-helix transcriptional regulator [Oerskovia merdavium]|uniref:AlpA family phage regulatory protein n=1 Tax=Oerskovia merdavium TaxID=2762227 RepID=A0ABR8TWR3_9CELL|nr:helix-turn-helix domain-containing protein [Oerskovia merdavium]MBD7980044.1 AlpA family phage regulatory protein [Oerskovia merdavium]
MTALLRTAEVAELLGLPEATLRYWRHCGTGPKSFTLGPRRVVYREDDVLAWVQAQYDKEHATT